MPECLIFSPWRKNDWLTHYWMVHTLIPFQSLPCSLSFQGCQVYQACQPVPLQQKIEIHHQLILYICNVITTTDSDQKMILPLSQDCQGNLVLPTMAKMAYMMSMREERGKKNRKRKGKEKQLKHIYCTVQSKRLSNLSKIAFGNDTQLQKHTS